MSRVTNHLFGGPGFSRRGRLLAAALGVLLAGGTVLGFAATRSDKETTSTPARPTALPVSTLKLEPQSAYEARRVFVGRVEPHRESAVGFELGGLLREVRVDEGDVVEAGQILASLDTARLEARRQELAAALEEARANRALAKITVKRLEGVVDAGGVSRQRLDEARAAYRAGRAAAGLARSRMETLDVDLAKSDLRAPFAAAVTARHVDEGRVLAAGAPVLTLQERAQPQVRVGIAGPLVDSVAVGQVHAVRIRGKAVPGHVKAVLPLRGAGTRTVDMILTLDGYNSHMRTGDLATLSLGETVPEAGFWLPIGALAEGTRGLWTTYVLEPVSHPRLHEAPSGSTHRIVPHPVEVLHEESDRVFVRGTLEPGARVVADGLHRVVPRQLVRLTAATPVQVADGRGRHVVD